MTVLKTQKIKITGGSTTLTTQLWSKPTSLTTSPHVGISPSAVNKTGRTARGTLKHEITCNDSTGPIHLPRFTIPVAGCEYKDAGMLLLTQSAELLFVSSDKLCRPLGHIAIAYPYRLTPDRCMLDCDNSGNGCIVLIDSVLGRLSIRKFKILIPASKEARLLNWTGGNESHWTRIPRKSRFSPESAKIVVAPLDTHEQILIVPLTRSISFFLLDADERSKPGLTLMLPSADLQLDTNDTGSLRLTVDQTKRILQLENLKTMLGPLNDTATSSLDKEVSVPLRFSQCPAAAALVDQIDGITDPLSNLRTKAKNDHLPQLVKAAHLCTEQFMRPLRGFLESVTNDVFSVVEESLSSSILDLLEDAASPTWSTSLKRGDDLMKELKAYELLLETGLNHCLYRILDLLEKFTGVPDQHCGHYSAAITAAEEETGRLRDAQMNSGSPKAQPTYLMLTLKTQDKTIPKDLLLTAIGDELHLAKLILFKQTC